jgi:hypothetical protein
MVLSSSAQAIAVEIPFFPLKKGKRGLERKARFLRGKNAPKGGFS